MDTKKHLTEVQQQENEIMDELILNILRRNFDAPIINVSTAKEIIDAKITSSFQRLANEGLIEFTIKLFNNK